MTNKELQEKIARLEAELAEVKEMAVAMKKRADGGVFKPEDRQKYWSIMSVGDVADELWDDNLFNHDRYEIGNCFPTKQAAEDTVRVLKLIQKARESQDGFVPDWEDTTQYKHSSVFYKGDIIIESHFSLNKGTVFGYWGDKSACEQFIDENEKDLLWFFTEYRR